MSPDSTNDSYNNTNLHIPKNKRRKKRRNSLKIRRHTKERETNEKFLHNLSSHQFADTQISLLSKGLQFIPTPSAKETRIKQQPTVARFWTIRKAEETIIHFSRMPILFMYWIVFSFYTFHILHILPHSHTFHTFYFTYIYCSISLTMPLIDRRKRGFLIFLTVVKGLIRILILSKLLLRDNITRCK